MSAYFSHVFCCPLFSYLFSVDVANDLLYMEGGKRRGSFGAIICITEQMMGVNKFIIVSLNLPFREAKGKFTHLSTFIYETWVAARGYFDWDERHEWAKRKKSQTF